MPLVMPEPAPVVPAALPAAPFIYLGRLDDDGKAVWFLQAGEDALAVSTGERITSQWQLESAREDKLVLLHLPSQQTQTLRISP